MSKKIIIISAHPDDEILGAGGTLVRHYLAGDEIGWLIATKITEQQGFSKERCIKRQEEIEKVESALKIIRTYQLGYPTMTLDTRDLQKLIPKIAEIFHDFKPERIYCVNRSDSHSDHRILFDAVMACTKSFRYPYIREVLMYECISETEFAPALPEKAFIPNCFVDISEQLEKKLELMRIYSSELGEHPFPRSEKNIEALATFRGATAGVKYAEAFQVLKSLRLEEL
ncbi:MAG: GlcNAc-PI de-N-acetylase [Candidatus Brocadia sp. WS118]|nr:MAG: GlcNAc-PI de-N-acetylase [Candidatus Brocadia sp. WS118]